MIRPSVSSQSSLITFLLLLTFFPLPELNADQQKPSNNDPSRFLGVKSWTGDIYVSMQEDTTFMVDCGSDMWQGQVKPYGKASRTTVDRAEMTLRVNIPVRNLDSDKNQDKTPEDESADKQMEQLNAMMERMQAITGDSLGDSDTDEAFDEMAYWGDVHFDGPLGVLGTGTVQWSRTENLSCPNLKERTEGHGSGPVKDASILLSVVVGKVPKYYSLSVSGWDKIPGTMKYMQKTLGHDEYCTSTGTGQCINWRRVPYWSTSYETIDPTGALTYVYKSGSKKNPEKAETTHSKTVPPMGLGIGANAAGISPVDLSGDKKSEPFGPTPEVQGMTSQAIADYHVALGNYHKKVYPQLPESGMTLQGSTTWREEEKDKNRQFVRTSTIRWNLAPQGSAEFEVEVTISGYEKWRPKGTQIVDRPGNVLAIQAQLMDAKTKKPSKSKAEKFIFTLEKTSKIPGAAMNWPPDPDKKPDLRFEASENPADRFTISEEGQKIETNSKQLLEGASVRLSSFDWGAYSELHVKAVMPGGATADGHLKDSSDRTILIPKRQIGSRIADVWKQKHKVEGKQDDSDDEKRPENRMPECTSHHGDGLTLYEEYRGFYSERDPAGDKGHIEGDPERKDYFVVDQMGSLAAAIYHFASISQLNTHAWLNQYEINRERVINFHQDPDHKNPVKQHAVVIKRSTASEMISQTVSKSAKGPSTPGSVEHILIGYGVDTADIMNTVPHELLHASNVWHHGDRDKQEATWEYGVIDGKEVIIEKKPGFQDKIIEAIFESNKAPLTPQGVKAQQQQGGGKPVDMYIAKQHGHHSGDVKCIMRYDLADAYDPVFPHSNRRVFIDSPEEPTGMGLCTTSQGTGVNAAPIKRHGMCDMLTNRGKCKYQICVNDKYQDAHTPRFAKG